LWNQQEASYNDATNYLGQQRAGMEGNALTSYNQGLSDIGFSQQENQALLDKQKRLNEEAKQKNLKDLAGNVRSLYQSGNIYLGSRGAGDSSASGMYAYALGKEALKNRTSIQNQATAGMTDIGDREASLGRLVTSEKAKLQSSYSQTLGNISQWFADAQRQLSQSRASSAGAMSQQVLDFALNAISQAKSDFTNKQSALQQWALSNSANYQQLQTNMQNVMSPAFQQIYQPTMSGINAQTSWTKPAYWSSGNTEEKKWF
jgi:hypothetical protein